MRARSFVASLAACLAIAGCGDSFHGYKYSLTVFAYDALTGAPIASADLAKGLAIYQGADKIAPAVLDSNVPGAVIFRELESDYVAGNKVFPIRATINGYQDFQGEVSFAINTYDNANPAAKQDDTFNQIGYVHLWPVGFHTPDYSFTVLYNGKPVPNATVQLSLGHCWDEGEEYSCSVQGGSWGAGNSLNHNIITPTYAGAIPALSGATDASGKATFAGAGLGLGLYYDVMVMPVVFNGVTLRLAYASSLKVGWDSVDKVVNLQAMSNDPTDIPHGVYVKSISPMPGDGQLSATCTMTLTFSSPVAKTSTFANDFSVVPTGFVGGVLGSPTATVTLSADGLTLTLNPNWTTAPTKANAGANCQYYEGPRAFYVSAYPADSFGLYDLSLGALGGPSLPYPLVVTAAAP